MAELYTSRKRTPGGAGAQTLTIYPGGALAAPRALDPGLFVRWLQFLDVAPKSAATYARAIRRFAAYLDETGTRTPTRETVLSYRQHLQDSGRKPATVQAYITAVKLFFAWTAQENLYPNIADHVKGAKLDKGHKKDYLTARQVERVLDTIDRGTLQGLRDYALLALMITAGLRTIEVIRADVADLRTVGDFQALFIQGKGHQEKGDYVKIAEPVEDALRDYLTARGPVRGPDPLFCSLSHRNAGGRMTTRSVSRIVKGALLTAGFSSDRLTAHSLRHTCATLNLLAGGTIAETQQLLRHTNINTTLIYSHALERAANNSEARVAAAVFGGADRRETH